MKGLMLYHNNMEDVESLATKALLKRAKIEVDSVSVSTSKQVKMAYETIVNADYLLDEINVNNYDFIIVPGGKYVSEVIDEDVKIKSLVSDFHNNDKMIFAICAAPMFLGELGLLKNRNYTIFPGCENDSYLGILKQDKKVVRDGNIITGRSVGAVVEFVSEIINLLKSEDAKTEFLKNIFY